MCEFNPFSRVASPFYWNVNCCTPTGHQWSDVTSPNVKRIFSSSLFNGMTLSLYAI
jgi:hypothetical protein